MLWLAEHAGGFGPVQHRIGPGPQLSRSGPRHDGRARARSRASNSSTCPKPCATSINISPQADLTRLRAAGYRASDDDAGRGRPRLRAVVSGDRRSVSVGSECGSTRLLRSCSHADCGARAHLAAKYLGRDRRPRHPADRTTSRGPSGRCRTQWRGPTRRKRPC